MEPEKLHSPEAGIPQEGIADSADWLSMLLALMHLGVERGQAIGMLRAEGCSCTEAVVVAQAIYTTSFDGARWMAAIWVAFAEWAPIRDWFEIRGINPACLLQFLEADWFLNPSTFEPEIKPAHVSRRAAQKDLARLLECHHVKTYFPAHLWSPSARLGGSWMMESLMKWGDCQTPPELFRQGFEIEADLDPGPTTVRCAYGNLRSHGSITIREGEHLVALGPVVIAGKHLRVGRCAHLEDQPAVLVAGEDLNLEWNSATPWVPVYLQPGRNLHLQVNALAELPEDLEVPGNLVIEGAQRLRRLPPGLVVQGDLVLKNCPLLRPAWPPPCVGGTLTLHECEAFLEALQARAQIVLPALPLWRGSVLLAQEPERFPNNPSAAPEASALANLDDDQLREILRRTDRKTLTLVCQDPAWAPFLERCLTLMSQRGGDQFRGDLDWMEKCPARARQAQDELLAIVELLRDEGWL